MSIEFEKAKGEIRQSAEILDRIDYIEKIVAQLSGDTILNACWLHPVLKDSLIRCFSRDDQEEHIEKYKSILLKAVLEDLFVERQSLISKVFAIRERKEDAQQ